MKEFIQAIFCAPTGKFDDLPYPSRVTDEVFSALKEAGINRIFGFGYDIRRETQEETLRFCEKYGIKYLPTMRSFGKYIEFGWAHLSAGEKRDIGVILRYGLFGDLPDIGKGTVDHLSAGADVFYSKLTKQIRGLGAAGYNNNVLAAFGYIRNDTIGACGGVKHDGIAVFYELCRFLCDELLFKRLFAFAQEEGNLVVRRFFYGHNAAAGA